MSRAEKQEVAVQQPGAVAVSDTAAVLGMIERAARDKDVDIDKMKALFELRNQVIAQQAERDFNDAMNQAQQEMRRVAVDSENPSTKSRYASYATLDRAVRPVYAKHGFSLSFNTEPGAPADQIRVLCIVAHSGGYTRKYQIDMPADGKGAKGGDVMTKTHAVGSGMTYGQRYLLKLIFNIAIGVDDDGNAADGTEPISDEQLTALRAALDDANADIPHFCEWFKIPSLAEMPAKRFNEAMAAIKTRKRAQAKK